MWAAIIIAAIIALALLAAPKADRLIAQSVIERWKPLVEKYRSFYPKIPLDWALGLIAWESKGDPNAVNVEKNIADPSDDSVGLMQITRGVLNDFNRATGKDYKPDMLKTPWVNVEVGMWNLTRHLNRFGDIRTTIRAHNGGAGGVSLSATARFLANVERYQRTVKQLLEK